MGNGLDYLAGCLAGSLDEANRKMEIKNSERKEIENRKKKKKRWEGCLFVKGNGGRKGRWETRRRRADEAMRNAERRGIGEQRIGFISGENRDKQYVNPTKAAVNCICNHKKLSRQ